jgi:hypothetical protein
MSLIVRMFEESCQERLMYRPVSFKRGCGCGMEHFANDSLYSYKSSQVSNFQSIFLTSVDDEFKFPSSLMAGQADRDVMKKNDTTLIRIQLTCNLHQLDANIFSTQKEKANHSYKAYLVSPTQKRTSLGSLLRHGDGMYKLDFKSDDAASLVQIKDIIVVYELDGNQQTLLSGRFQ